MKQDLIEISNNYTFYAKEGECTIKGNSEALKIAGKYNSNVSFIATNKEGDEIL